MGLLDLLANKLQSGVMDVNSRARRFIGDITRKPKQFVPPREFFLIDKFVNPPMIGGMEADLQRRREDAARLQNQPGIQGMLQRVPTDGIQALIEQPAEGKVAGTQATPTPQNFPNHLVERGGRLFLNHPIADRVANVIGKPLEINRRAVGIIDALNKAGIPLTPHEIALIQLESSFDTSANPGVIDGQQQTAFGLGQLQIGHRENFGGELGFSPDTIDPVEQVLMKRAYVNNKFPGGIEEALETWLKPRWVERRQRYEHFY